MRTNFIIITIFILASSMLTAQEDDYQIGLNTSLRTYQQGALYDYSDPNGINIKVAVWGYVRFPGKYVIPIRSDIKDLISYSGGVSDNSYLDDLRIYRMDKDSSQVMLKFNYEDLWWSEDLKGELKLQKLQPGDILVVPGRPRLYFENYLSLILGVLTTIVSVATLIITINK
jgi:hypothetical protein